MTIVNIIPKKLYGSPKIWVIGQKFCSEKYPAGFLKSLKSKLLVHIDSNMALNNSKEVLLMFHEVISQNCPEILAYPLQLFGATLLVDIIPNWGPPYNFLDNIDS